MAFKIRDVALAVGVLVTAAGCQSHSIPTYPDIRPVVVMEFDYPLQSSINNAPALRKAIGSGNADGRQIVVIANIGKGGGSVAMERARNSAMLAASVGEKNPRLYVRAPVQGWQAETVEIYSFGRTEWSDRAFSQLMETENLAVDPWDGVMLASKARYSIDQVIQHTLHIPSGNLSVVLKDTLASVGWQFAGKNVPSVQVNGATVVVALSDPTNATPDESYEITRAILSLANTPLTINPNTQLKTVEVYGEIE